MSYRIEPLGPSTREAFAELVERNGGIHGGCWCIAFHARCDRQGDHRQAKERLVHEDRQHRGRRIAHAAVDGALGLIGEAGGGLVEVIAETVDGRSAQSRFLLSGTAEMFEDKGFERVRQVGKHAWVLHRRV